MMSVFVCGLSMPLSMMVVATSTSMSPRWNFIIMSSTCLALILPWATPTRASGAASSTRASASSIVLTRLLT